MALEIEKKFLLTRFPESELRPPTFISQGYISRSTEQTVRVRVSGNQGSITIKGPTINGSRKEFEYPIPAEDAKEMLDLFCPGPVIEKNRYHYIFKGFKWEIDQFFGDNQGLIVAEIELESIDQSFDKPDWIGREVTDEPRYFNSNLVKHPYSSW